MQKKGYLFLAVTLFVFIFAFYAQIFLMRNDVRTYFTQAKYEETNVKEFRLPVEVMTDSTIYVTYNAEVDGEDMTFSLVDQQGNTIMKEEGQTIDLSKKKIKLKKGNYRFFIQTKSAKKVMYRWKIIHRSEEVMIMDMEQ